MLDNKSLTIGVLSVTAIVLAVGIAVVASLPRPALAVGQTDRGGDYLMVTSQYNTGTELVYVLDGATGGMAAYAYDINLKQIRPWDTVDFARLLGGNRQGQPPRVGRR